MKISKIAIILILLGLIQGLFLSTPELTFSQYQELGALVDDAELAAMEGVGGRHNIVVSVLRQWGFIVTGASWQIVVFAKRLLDKGWKPGTEPRGIGDW